MAGMSDHVTDRIIAELELLDALTAAGYRIVPPAQTLDDQLLGRMESFASDLQVLSGMTRRGAVLPQFYREHDLLAIRNMALRVLDALAAGGIARHPWEKTDG